MIGSTLLEILYKLWPMLVIFTVILITVRIYYLKLNHKKFIFYKEIINYLFLIYILLLFELVTNRELGAYSYNLIPGTEIFRYKLGSYKWYQNVLGNIVLFIPIGYFISNYINSKTWKHIFIISFIVSLTIELVQLKIGRAMDIDDIILNVSGGVIGYLIYKIFLNIKKRLPNVLKSDTFYNILCIIVIIIVILFFVNKIRVGW